MLFKKTLSFIALLIALCTGTPLYSQLDWQEIDIPMSDGQSLAADLYLPGTCTSCPVVLIQTPYNKNLFHFGLPLGVGINQAASNYAFVILDWRGRFASQSAWYQGAPTMGQDGYDAVEWIAAQSWCDGHIGTWGPSALAVVQYATAKEAPPHLTCICPLVGSPQQNYLDYYPGGALRTEYIEQLDVLGFGVSQLVLAAPYYNLVWQFSESNSFYPAEIGVPALMIGGWYDHNVETMIQFFEGIRVQSPALVKDQHRLVMGPWAHGGNGSANPGTANQGELSYPAAEGIINTKANEFFDYYLREIDNGWSDTPFVTYFQMGDDVWTNAPAWPPANMPTQKLYLQEGLVLNHVAPVQSNSSTTFTYDPTDPSPTVGGPTLRSDLEQGPYDQAPLVESRNDILVFTSPELTEDAAMAGKALVHLRISTYPATDTDVAVRLCDVYPDGRSMLVVDGIKRMRFINGYTQAQQSFLTPGQVYTCEIELPHTALTFKAGHRIRLDISGSNYPRFNRNMNTGDSMYPEMNPDTLVNPITTTTAIFHSTDEPSWIELPMLSFVTQVDEAAASGKLKPWPNPAIDELNLGIWCNLVELTDCTGRTVKYHRQTGSISVAELPAGVYLLKAEAEHENLCTCAVVVTH